MRTLEEKRVAKRDYDAAYRERNRTVLRAKKAAYYKATADRAKEAEARRVRMPMHVEYCRRPEYRAKKHEYDIVRVSAKYGEFAEAHRLLVELEREIRRQMPDKYERLKARGYYERQNMKARDKRATKRSERTR